MARLPTVNGDDGNWGTVLNSFLQVSHNTDGSLLQNNITTQTANYTAQLSDGVILVDASSGAVTITLPTAVGNNKFLITIKKVDSSTNRVTIATNPSSQTIDGFTTLVLTSQYTSYSLISNGTNWYIAYTPITKNKFLYLPDGWDTGWLTAKAASSTTACWITGLGDSVMCGFNSDDYRANSYFGLIQAALIARGYANYAEYFPSEWKGSGVNVPGTAPWVMNKTPGANVAQYGYFMNWTGFTSSDVLATFTSPIACTALDINYYDQNTPGHTWKYAIDGGADQTVTLANTAAQSRVRITGLSNTTHTVTVGKQSNDLDLFLNGISVYPSGVSGTGIGYARFAHSGFQIGNYGQSNPGGDMPTLWQGKTIGAGAQTTGFGFPTQPSLAILAQGLNDCAQLSTVSCGPLQYKNFLRRFVQAIKRGQTNSSIIILAYNSPDTANSDITSGRFTNANNWFLYINAMREIAQEYNCAFVNIEAKWGETPVAQGFVSSTSAHPTNAGHADIANTILSII